MYKRNQSEFQNSFGNNVLKHGIRFNSYLPPTGASQLDAQICFTIKSACSQFCFFTQHNARVSKKKQTIISIQLRATRPDPRNFDLDLVINDLVINYLVINDLVINDHVINDFVINDLVINDLVINDLWSIPQTSLLSITWLSIMAGNCDISAASNCLSFESCAQLFVSSSSSPSLSL